MSTIAATDPTSDLFFYALHGNVPGILSALDAGADPNAELLGIHEFTILFAMSKSVSQEKQKEAWLDGLKREVSKFARTRTPLLLASEFGRYDAVLALLEHGANPSWSDEDGTTPLWAAAQRRQSIIVRLLLRSGAEVDAADREGQTPLFRAVAKGDLESVRLLLAAGADANKITPIGVAPLLLAARRGQEMEICSADLSKQRRPLLSDQYEELITDVKGGEFAVLLQERRLGSFWGRPPKGNYPAIVAELLAYGADSTYILSPTDSVYRATTVLREAASMGCEQTVQMLLAQGVEINTGEGEVGTALLGAAFSGNPRVVALLLEHGASVNSATSNGFTPLMAASYAHPDVVEMLLNAGADVTRRTTDGNTVLDKAFETCNSRVIQLLLSRGAETGNRQLAPLLAAAKGGATQVAAGLLDAGADISATDKYGRTALHFATRSFYTQQLYLISQVNPGTVLAQLIPRNEEDKRLLKILGEAIIPSQEKDETNFLQESQQEQARVWFGHALLLTLNQPKATNQSSRKRYNRRRAYYV